MSERESERVRTQSIREQSHEVKSFGGRRKERTLRDPLSKIATRRPRVSDTPHVDGRTFWSHRFRLRGKKGGRGEEARRWRKMWTVVKRVSIAGKIGGEEAPTRLMNTKNKKTKKWVEERKFYSDVSRAHEVNRRWD